MMISYETRILSVQILDLKEYRLLFSGYNGTMCNKMYVDFLEKCSKEAI